MRKHFKIIILFFVLLQGIFYASCLMAEDVSFQATVDRNKVSLWDIVHLTLTASGGKPQEDIVLPEMSGFKAQYLGPSSRVTIINGQYSSTNSYNYTLFPVAVGEYTIPAIGVKINGDVYTTDPIDIEVVDKGGTKPEDERGKTSMTLNDKIFMTFESSKKDISIGEKTTFSIRLYSTDVSLADVQYPVFNDDYLEVGDFNKPKQYGEIIGGVQFKVVEFDVDVYPTEAGELKLGPATLSCNVLYKREGGKTSSFGGLFSDDFFNSVFDKTEKMPIQVKSKGLTLNISPLPNPPKNGVFSGGVGEFSFSMTASPDEVKVGDPITVKMRVTGDGAMERVEMPKFEDNDDFKVYEPQIKEESGDKILEQVLVPKNDKVKEIPKIAFIYFSTKSKKYETVSQGPIPIVVKPADEKEKFGVYEMSRYGKPVTFEEKIGRDIIYIKDMPGRVRKKGYWVYKSLKLKIIIFILLGIYLGLYFYYKHYKKVTTDTAYARNISAYKKAKQNMARSKALLDEESLADFYNKLFNTLQEYIGDKLHLASSGLTAKEMEDIFRKHNMPDVAVVQLKNILDKCDQVRFASATQSVKDAKEILTICRHIIDSFERKVR